MSPMPGNLLQRRVHRVVQETGNRERLSVGELELGLRPPRGERRNAEPAQDARRCRSRAC